jgi:hypothetical protein
VKKKLEHLLSFLNILNFFRGEHDILEMDCCLCQCDIEETFLVRNIPFKMDCGDFFVGDLDEVKGD